MPGNYGTNFHAPRVDVHQFAMIPRANIPRSQFRMQSQHKTTINASLLYPVYLQEVLPGDSYNVSMTAFVRLATPLFPIMDNIELESFFFFVPCRLIWKHWYQFMGQEDVPGASISFSIPQIVSPVGGFAQLSIYDYFGLPCTGQTGAGNTISVSALPLRAYALTYSEWFRDENLSNPALVGAGGGNAVSGGIGIGNMDDGPDANTLYGLFTVAKRHDYFTSCLPFTQKGTAGPVTLPLGTSAPVKTSAAWQRPDITSLTGNVGVRPMEFVGIGFGTNAGNISNMGAGFVQSGATTTDSVTGGPGGATTATTFGSFTSTAAVVSPASPNNIGVLPVNLYADLSVATAATINSIRLAFQTQKLLERDARGGTRYTEIVRSHFGVLSPDARLMRPEYLGGGKQPITITPVPQTTQTGLTGGTSPLGTLAAVGTGVMRHGFRSSFTEHGYILGLVTARADQVYQQGIRKLWSRLTRYDFYWPVFAALGEQAVLNKEIFSDGSANDALTFGFNERWAEYRYHPSFTSGFFRSTNATPLDAWHLGVKFSVLPTLNNAFISDPTTTILQRNLALGASSNNQQLLCDFFFDQRVARPMPMYSVPGLIDHF